MSSITKWLAAGSVAAVGAVTAVVATAAPGSSRTSTNPNNSSNSTNAGNTGNGGVSATSPTTSQPQLNDPGTDITPSSPDDNGFVPPTDPPVRIHRQPVTRSGGS